MEAAVPEVVPDPSGTVVPVASDSSAVLDVVEDEDAVEEDEVADEDAVEEDEVPVSTPAGVPVPSPSGHVLGPAPSVPVTETVQAPSGPLVPVVPVTVSGPSGFPVGPSLTVSAVSPEVASGPSGVLSAPSCVASCRIFTPDLRRKFFLGYREMLCKCSEDTAYVCSYRGYKVVEVVPFDNPDEVRITFESGASIIVHVNHVRVSRVDTSGEVSEEEFARFILKVKDDPSYRISFRGSIVDMVGPTEHSNVLDVVFSDHTGSQSQRLPARALWVKNIAPNSNSSSANVNNSVNNVNNVSSSSPTAGDGVVSFPKQLSFCGPYGCGACR